MIHQVFLPDVTRKRLTDVVMLQIRLLSYAASTALPDQTSCAHYLDQCARFRGRGSQIAAWLWRGSGRRKPLERFAQGPPIEKRVWSQSLSREALACLRHPVGPLVPYVSKNAASWQKSGAAFLLKFYDDLCDPRGLPGDLFSEPATASFSRQDFLAGFIGTNSHLNVCAVCDESGYHTVVDDSIRTGIEHYLPKNRYPHLSCHPFNLLPICLHCNTLVKGEADPLNGRANNRRGLEDVLLPYRESGLGSRTYLEVRLGKTSASTRLGQLKPRTATDLRQRIAAFGDIYKVPRRWQGQVNTIGETLFRQIRRFLSGWNISGDHPMSLLNALDQLLCDLYANQGKEPFAFAMTWWLATLINQEVEPATHNPSHAMPQVAVLLQALSIGSDQDRDTPSGPGIATSSQQLATARSLRELIR